MTSTFDTAAFALPPQVAKMDAVRKLAARLSEVTGMGQQAADTVANAVVDPAAVRAALNEELPGLTAARDSHLQVIPVRVWTPWATVPADNIHRYLHQKVFPVADPSVPRTPQATETRDGLIFDWDSPADREWHLKDNRRLYDKDVYADGLRIFPHKGGIFTPLVMVPQTEIFGDGSESQHSLRIADGRRRFFEVRDLLERYASLDEEGLAGHFGPGVITPEIFKAALDRDRAALGKVVNAVRAACVKAGDGNDFRQHIGVHYLASCLTLPAYIAVGTVDPVTSEIRPLGNGGPYPAGVDQTLDLGLRRWHTGGGEAKLSVTGQKAYNGLLLPEAAVDQELIDTAIRRLRARGVPKEALFFGQGPSNVRASARFVWWCRAIRQLGGTPATAAAAFALHTEPDGSPWPQSASRSLLACAAHVMEEDVDTIYPPGDYRDAEARPDSLSLLVVDAKNLIPVAALSGDGKGGVLAHPRFRNAAHIALANLAFIGALPAEEPLPERITGHVHLLSRVAICWANNQISHFVKASGALHHDADGRPVPIDERTLTRDDLPWPKDPVKVGYLMPPTVKHSYPQASHVFKLRHDVVYTIPRQSLDEVDIDATPEALAAVVRRWFPDATGIALTDWSDKFITGVMVGSVFVRLFDRGSEREGARHRGVWYPEGRPSGTKDVLDFDTKDSGAPVGRLFGLGPWVTPDEDGSVDMLEVEEAWYRELDDDIINEVDAALDIQREADTARGNSSLVGARVIPVLRLPAVK